MTQVPAAFLTNPGAQMQPEATHTRVHPVVSNLVQVAWHPSLAQVENISLAGQVGVAEKINEAFK